MKFFRCAVYVLFMISLCNLGFSAYMFRELRKPRVIVAPHPEMKMLHEQTTMRDTQMFKGILMIHHAAGIHPPGKQQMCPLCEEAPNMKAISQPTIANND